MRVNKGVDIECFMWPRVSRETFRCSLLRNRMYIGACAVSHEVEKVKLQAWLTVGIQGGESRDG